VVVSRLALRSHLNHRELPFVVSRLAPRPPRVAGAADGARGDALDRAVGQHRVDLPLLAVRGALDPELVLFGVAAGRPALVDRGQAGGREPGLLGVDGVGVGHLDAEVVERAAPAGVLDQDQLERRLDDGEVGVARPDLGRLGGEQRGVEGDRRVEVVDVEGELEPGHGVLLGDR
jgi:hypothetical protein